MIGVLDLFDSVPKRILLFGVGGGGDVVSAAMLGLWFRRYGFKTFIGAVAWERFVIDPLPGPLPFNTFYNIKKVSDNVIAVTKDTYAIRGSKKIKPQVAYVSEVINEHVYVIDLWGGVNDYRDGVNKLIEYLDIDAIIIVDVGGDILATGHEDNLWSPLADSMGLACFNSFNNCVLAVHGLGADGELDPSYLLSRISLIAREGGLLGAKGITLYEARVLEQILSKAISEASKIPLLAYKGFYGEYPVRKGTRKVYVTPLQTITFFLDVHVVYKNSPIALIVDNTNSLEEANSKLNSLGIYTEYNLEKDLLRHPDKPLDPQNILYIREKYRSLLRSKISKNSSSNLYK